MAASVSHYDVVVVGSGLAGLTSAIEAADAGATVAIIDKEQKPGGNSAKASSGMNSVGSSAQSVSAIEDSIEKLKQDTLKSGHGLCNEELVQKLADEAKAALEFLIKEGHGESLKMDDVVLCGGHAVPRTHRSKPTDVGKPAPNIGWEATSTLVKRLKDRPSITLLTGYRVEDIIKDGDGKVIGLECAVSPPASGGEVTHQRISAGAVVLATGGYGADRHGLLKQYVPERANLATTNGPFALGEGVKLAVKIGAATVDMDQIQVHPTGFVDPKDPANGTKFLAPEALRGVGGILLNEKGERFVDELGRRDEVTNAIFNNVKALKLPDGSDGPVTSYLILNGKARERYGLPTMGFYESKQLFKRYDSYKEFAEAVGMPVDTVRQTLEDYARFAKGDAADPFGKKVFPVAPALDEPLFVAMITPSIHYTMGGIKINTHCQVISTDDKPIPGLYGAGEVTGGVHGGNRLAGNSLLETVVFGRTAGKESAAFAKSLRASA